MNKTFFASPFLWLTAAFPPIFGVVYGTVGPFFWPFWIGKPEWLEEVVIVSYLLTCLAALCYAVYKRRYPEIFALIVGIAIGSVLFVPAAFWAVGAVHGYFL